MKEKLLIKEAKDLAADVGKKLGVDANTVNDVINEYAFRILDLLLDGRSVVIPGIDFPYKIYSAKLSKSNFSYIKDSSLYLSVVSDERRFWSVLSPVDKHVLNLYSLKFKISTRKFLFEYINNDADMLSRFWSKSPKSKILDISL